MLSADIKAENIDIVSADARMNIEQQLFYGVDVVQGAFTVYNFNPSSESSINAELKGIKIGRKGAPVLGSGIMISGYSEENGSVYVSNLETDDIYSNAMISDNQANMISGGLIILKGVKVESVRNKGSVSTYGVNDMVLDNWGEVDKWIVDSDIISYGPSGIGLVNFGTINSFEAKAPIITKGKGARGFNLYDGYMKSAVFDSIKTFGDGSIGIQISKPMGTLEIKNDIETFGGTGNSLVLGKIVTLEANAMNLKPGAEIEDLQIGGNLVSHGDHVDTYVDGGAKLPKVQMRGTVKALGENSNSLRLLNGNSKKTY